MLRFKIERNQNSLMNDRKKRENIRFEREKKVKILDRKGVARDIISLQTGHRTCWILYEPTLDDGLNYKSFFILSFKTYHRHPRLHGIFDQSPLSN